LVSFGNLRWFREWSPYVSFYGWIAEIVGGEDGVKNGCVMAPKCRTGKAKGDMMCGECASARAARCLDNPRFFGHNKFTPQHTLEVLIEDVYTKANLEWFWNMSEELQLAVVGEKALIDELRAGKVCVDVNSSGKVLLKSTREPFDWVNQLHESKRIMFVSNGLLKQELTAAECRTAEVNTGLGLGWELKVPDTDSNILVGEFKVEEAKEGPVELDFHPLPSSVDSPDASSHKVWLFLRNGSWSVWRECGVVLTGKAFTFKMWKNQHPKMSKALDLFLILLAMCIMYLACSSAYVWMSGFVRRKFSQYWTSKEEIKLEAKGSLSRHRAKAGGAKSEKNRFEKDQQLALVKDAEFDRGDRGEFREKLVKFKNYVFYDIQDLGENRPTGLLMIHPVTGQKMAARNQEAFDALAADGFKPDSSTINAPTISIDLDAWRADPTLREAVKVMHFVKVNKGKCAARLSDYQKVAIQKQLGGDVQRASPAVKALYLLATSPSEKAPTSQERQRFFEMREDGVINLESNVQMVFNKSCPHALAGKKCGEGCIRCAQSTDPVAGVKFEGVVGPLKRTPDQDNVYKIMLRDYDASGGWEKVGTCFGAPLGLLTARHVFYGDTSDLLAPLKEFRVETWDGRRFEIEPMSLITPTREQLVSGQSGDFCRFQCLDKAFMKEVNDHRAAFRVLHGTGLRLLHFPPDSVRPVLATGKLVRKDTDTGVCIYDINTWASDSGSPIYSDDGHVVGLHQGYHVGLDKNAFVLIYPDQLVTWFVQSQPLN
jgi:hypothetical protein